MKPIILSLFLIIATTSLAEDIARFKLRFDTYSIDTPISISLDGINYNSDNGSFVLYETSSKKEVAIPCQIEPGHTATLWFVLKGKIEKGSTRKFVLRQESTTITREKINLKKDNEDLEIIAHGKSVLKYRFVETQAPKEADPLYKRSGYIHPLNSPGGACLTTIQPEDHYHHYGIWGPWTKTHINGREVDFWNIKKGQGTVKFNGFLSETEGDVFTGFKSLQQHIDFGAKGPDAIAMNELLDIRVWNVDKNIWIIDYTTSLSSPLDSGIILDAYRYGGGIGYRAHPQWHKDNCTVLTSEGKTRLDADGTNARWCIVEGETKVNEGRSGILFMSHPSNRMHPEPMRVWPLNANGKRGDMFFEFCPIRHENWKLNKNQTYTLKYRMIVFDGKLNAETAEMYWTSFAKIPEVEIE